MQVEPLNPELQRRLPSPSNVALAIMDACQRESASVQDVVSKVQADPALVGRLLAQANAAAMGGRAVASAGEAVRRLGLATVRRLTLTFSLLDEYGRGRCTHFDYAAFWSHSLLMGLALSDIGGQQRLGSPEDLFTCGLLARIGSLGLATAYPDVYGKLLSSGAQGAELARLEQQDLQLDHTRLSYLMLQQWGFPDALTEPVLFFENLSSTSYAVGTRGWSLVHALHLALQVADFIVASPKNQVTRLTEFAVAAGKVGWESDALGQCVDRVAAQWRVWGERLNVPTTTPPDFASIASAAAKPERDEDAHLLRVLIAEDDPIILGMLQAWLLENEGHTVMTAGNGRDALVRALDFKPHVMLTDWRMPVMDGIAMCKVLRKSEWGQKIYVLMLTSADQEDDLVTAFEAGVDDYLTKPVNLRALSARLKAAWRYVRLRETWETDHARITGMLAELAQSNRRLQLAALTDPLTQLANRRAGMNALTQAWSSAVRHGHLLTVISIDIDHFKSVNDAAGHAAGDKVLQEVALCLRDASRQEDTVCRWGGEEFLLVSPNMSLEDAIRVAERLRSTIDAMQIQFGNQVFHVTASFGLAACDTSVGNLDNLLANADQALYLSKSAGRNCVSVFSNVPTDRIAIA